MYDLRVQWSKSSGRVNVATIATTATSKLLVSDRLCSCHVSRYEHVRGFAESQESGVIAISETLPKLFCASAHVHREDLINSPF